jgi:hypothetical protein
MIAKLILAFLLIITILVGYSSIQAVAEPTKVEKKVEDKSKCFCNGLSLPQERQCPTMNDL